MGTARGTSGSLVGVLAEPGSASAATLRAVAEEIRGCTRCPLARGRTGAVPGEGNPLTDVLFVGEGPGAREDATGRPFVGPAGQLLGELLGSIGWERRDVFITNVVKCRPPGNRDPEPGEIAACRDHLDRQERAIDPAIVVTLGRHSLARYLPGARIGQVHGTLRRAGDGRHVFPMYHPAAALHQASLRETLFRDIRGLPAALLAVRRVIEEERAALVASVPVASEGLAEASAPSFEPPHAPDAEQPQQMTLF
jgi:uracil-DNA glycosylase family 4